LVLKSLQAALHIEVPGQACLEFTEACLPHVPDLLALMAVILPAAMHIAHGRHNPLLGADLLELYLRCNPNNLEILGHLASFLQNAREYDRGIDVARSRLVLSDSPAEKVFSSHLVLRGLMTAGGYWQEALAAASEHEQILASLSLEALAEAQSTHILRLFTAPYFFPYLSDDLKKNRSIQNQVIQLSQTALQIIYREQVERYRQRHQTSKQRSKPLKIGYLSHCMGTHSVGFLARWLMQHHDRDRFQLYGYFMYKRHNDPLFDWYRDQFSQTCIMGVDCADDSCEVAERIFQDEIDILIDLDSITLDMTCTVLALKPAPIQISWLGWDASGLPAVDYFLADPYVLPDWAQNYYPEKIWRLPHTYIAIDGFEVGIPNLRRQDLELPEDAVLYLSAQRGFKRHPETTKLQMQILRQVPNSYFLIKGIANEDSTQEFFNQIAIAEGVDPARLRFLPQTSSEMVHRANLAIADVVLDTFPYNGATTTLETLWMGVPLVTRVGDQFASRNSYTMLVNAGIEAGIAWNDQEYVEWGVRYGTEPDLRQQIHWQLLKSRQSAPLWNGKQFTQEVENAYEQMWQNYRNIEE
jgi:predicted O-linked N-acetylglucosamine transferase (SPINDLY family)